jgi:hypothetical protein
VAHAVAGERGPVRRNHAGATRAGEMSSLCWGCRS